MSDTLIEICKQLDSRAVTARMPVLFVGHGSPLNAINSSEFARAWQEIGEHLPVPRAIVCMSAHWLTNGTFVSAASRPELIYDFYGFPPALYDVQYPAHGDPTLAAEIASREPTIQIDATQGLDHGAWTVLMHLFPDAQIPVLQMSIDVHLSRKEQYELMQHLKSLRDRGVLFVGSGNIIHNLRQIREGVAHDWAIEFDALSKKLIAEHNHEALLNIEQYSAHAALALPTDEHYRPMLNTLALVDIDESLSFFNEEIDLGSVSMRSFISFPK
jgi:4,5-DOPA dioxygenase extradiol